jgi:hypothetical protein
MTNEKGEKEKKEQEKKRAHTTTPGRETFLPFSASAPAPITMAAAGADVDISGLLGGVAEYEPVRV